MDQNRQNKGFFRSLAEFVVNKQWLFGILFAVLAVFSVFSLSWVNIEEDITEYLPDSAEAKQGLTIMSDEFVTYGSARIMVDYVTRDVANELYEEISAVDGVFSVTYDETEDHYKEGSALYDVSFNGVSTDENVVAAMDAIKAILGDHIYYVDSEVGYSLVTTLMTEMLGVGVIVAIVVLAVLVLTSSTFAEVLVLIATFIMAALLNMGTNFVFSKISFISYAIAVVLQLALSVDYAIIFCNRYKEEHEKLPIKEAVTAALTKSIPEISASSLTTIAGLAAMTFMNFRLGLDMGVSLIKAIICSLISVFFFMPVMLLLCGKLMDKTRHRSFVPKIPFVGKFGYAARFVIPPIFAVLVVGAYILFNQTNYAYTVDLIEYRTHNEQTIAEETIDAKFGSSNLIALLVPAGDYESEKALAEELSALDEVESVTGLASIEVSDGYELADSITYQDFAGLADIDSVYAQALFAYYAAANGEQAEVTADLANYRAPIIDLFLFLHDNLSSLGVELEPEQTELIDTLYDTLQMASVQLQGENYSRIIVTTKLPVQSDETFDFLDRLHVIAKQYYPEGVVLTGDSVSAQGFSDTFGQDTTTVSLLSLVFVMLILLFTFHSVVMPVLLVLVIQGSIWLNFAIAAASQTYIFFMTYLIVSSIQMGANIDYAIVVSSRYNECRNTMGKREAIIDTMNFAFPTIITSGSMMVVAGFVLGYKVSQSYIAQMGMFVGQGTLITLCLVMFALPQLLTLGDGIVRATSFHAAGRVSAKLRRAGFAVLTAAALLIAVVSIPIALFGSIRNYNNTLAEDSATLNTVQELRAIADELDLNREQYDATKLSFAEGLVTDVVGSEQLEEGQAEYDAGAEQLEEGQTEYDSGAAQVAAARAQLAAGQAQYDAGTEQLAAAKEEYAEAESQLNSVSGLYNSVKPAYDNMNSLEQQYNAAMESGDQVQAAILYAQWQSASAVFNTQIGSTGYSISSLMAAYEDAQQQLADASAQIAAAEEQLAEGKAQLDSGYAQVAAAEKQLAEGKEQLDEGYEELADAADQLEEGKETLAENKEQLNSDLAALDNYTDTEEKLAAGTALLMQDDDIAAAAGKNATYAEVLTAAENCLNEEISDMYREYNRALIGSLLLLAACGALLVGVICGAKEKRKAAVTACGISAAVAAATAAFMKMQCPHVYLLPMIAGILLAVAAVILAQRYLPAGAAIPAAQPEAPAAEPEASAEAAEADEI